MKWYKDQKTIDLNKKEAMDGWRQRILVRKPLLKRALERRKVGQEDNAAKNRLTAGHSRRKELLF